MFDSEPITVGRLLVSPIDTTQAGSVCHRVDSDLADVPLETELRADSRDAPCHLLFRRDALLMAMRMANLDGKRIGRIMNAAAFLELMPEEWPGRRLKTPEEQMAFLMGEYQRLWSGDDMPVPVSLRLCAREDIHVMRQSGENFFVYSSYQFAHAMEFLSEFFRSWLRTLRERHGLDDDVCCREEKAILAVMDEFVRKQRIGLEEEKGKYEELKRRQDEAAKPKSLAGRLSVWLAKAARDWMADTNREPGRRGDGSAMAQLRAMTGLQSVKEQVAELEAFILVQRERQQRGLKTPPLTLHMVFTGNPGTGKTTVARIVAKLLHELGLLKENKLVETDRQHLVGEYLGSTAPKTQAVIDKAMGGVLFIDEAYSLYGDQFGDEAIATLLKNMEDHRDRFVVIVAGYEKPIRRMIDSNPGLQSRFSRYIDFPDYTAEELFRVLDSLCRANDYQLAEEAREPVQALIREIVEHKDENFANAREVRNLFDRARTRQTLRLRGLKNAGTQVYRTLTAEDFGIQKAHGGETT